MLFRSGMDSGDKATTKAMAIAFKYACFQVFCIPTEEMKDPDAETPPENTPIKKPAQPPEKPDIPNDMKFICDNCKEVLTPYINSKGKEVPIRQIAAESQARFGKTLCVSCAINEGKAHEQ